ncbi:CLUMA_CG018840, isoform A [Clunio marinus]|uniref:protein-histidine N-methyltransferase n=1 Tax=Clunio marinus TaxID=568069 RepID=A0A1J1J219_9DIPT|nr:CLUMA_CG018840, isoform A [Clunio marinus]
MFKFNFNNESAEIDEEFSKQSQDVPLKESKKIEWTQEQYRICADNIRNSKVNCFVSNDIEIGYLDSTSMVESNDTDLIPRVYEGGFKIWECTQDLADLFSNNEGEVDFQDKIVCDLGCSAGVLGILSLVKNAVHLDFQDYNEEVLEKFTMPNVILNCEERSKPEDFLKCTFYCGDWTSFADLTCDDRKYDIILTSETIYNPESYSKLIELFKARLDRKGKIYLSAKSYYFGVAGNILDFIKYLEKDGSFNFDILWKSINGVQREILLIKFKCEK